MSPRPGQTLSFAIAKDRALVVRSVFVVLASAMLLLVAYAAATTADGAAAKPAVTVTR